MNQNDRISAKKCSDEIVVRYPPNTRVLPNSQEVALSRWTARCLAQRPGGVFAVACNGGLTPTGRLERVRRLRDTLVKCGVLPDRVRYTVDSIGRTDTLPLPGEPVVAHVKVLSASALDAHVRPMRALFQPASGQVA